MEQTQESDARWRQARTLGDLGVCMADWLEGRLGPMPTTIYRYNIDPETRPSLKQLVPLNRKGIMLTTFSQRGHTTTERERFDGLAAVQGFVSLEHYELVARTLKSFDLGVTVGVAADRVQKGTTLIKRPSVGQGGYGWGGLILGKPQIKQAYQGLDPQAVEALRDSVQVFAWDKMWGRNTVLWPALEEVVSRATSS